VAQRITGQHAFALSNVIRLRTPTVVVRFAYGASFGAS